MATLRITFLSALVLELLATLGVALVAVSVGLRLVFGEVELAAGLTALLLAPEVFWPLRRVGAEFHAAQDGKTAAEKAFALLDGAARLGGRRMPPVPRSASRTSPSTAATATRRTVDRRHRARLGHRADRSQRRGQDHRAARHPRARRPTSGRVSVGGVDVAELDLRAGGIRWRGLPQRPALVPGTVRENLDLFGPLADLDSACRRAGFDDVLAVAAGWVGHRPRARRRRVCRWDSGSGSALARALGSGAPSCCSTSRPHTWTPRWRIGSCAPSPSGRAPGRRGAGRRPPRAPCCAVGDRVVQVGGEVLVAC